MKSVFVFCANDTRGLVDWGLIYGVRSDFFMWEKSILSLVLSIETLVAFDALKCHFRITLIVVDICERIYLYILSCINQLKPLY